MTSQGQGQLAGRSALVTGGLRGIGRAIVAKLAGEGAHVLATDLDDGPGDFLTGVSRRSAYRRLDVTRDDDWAAALDALEAEFGPIDILVNNAGTNRTGSIATATEADWHAVMSANALSIFLGCGHAVRRMGQRGGAIVNIASARGRRTGAAQCVYSASKAAAISLTESVALHCGESGLPIRCNAVLPGVVDTPLMRAHAATLNPAAAQEMVDAMAAMQVMGRLGSADEIAAAVVFLASDAASFITGEAISVDGGFRIRDR